MLDERRSLHLGFQLHKTIHGNVTGSPAQFMKPINCNDRAVTRDKSSNDMIIAKVRSGMGQKGIAYRGPAYLNKLPQELKIVSISTQFKRMLSSMVHQLFGDHPT